MVGGGGTASPVGEALRRHRLAAGLTQDELARRAGISVRGLRDLEQGRIRQPRARSVGRLVEALGLSAAARESLLGVVLAAEGAERRQLRVGVLGPLVVCCGGAEVDIPSRRQRALLGLLALHRADVVPVSEIVDVLWGQDPPRTARTLVQMYVSQLRALLGVAGQVLRSAQGGYAVELTDQQLDLAQFDEAVVAAQTVESAEQAAELYARALEYWRGPVLADAAEGLRWHPAVTAAASRRVAAAVAYADVAFALGVGGQAIAPLRALSHEEPLHEAVHGWLMLALAATGEQAAALHVYADLRTRLAEELGVEPGPEIQAVQLRILRGQVPGGTAPTGEELPRVPVPAQLPIAPRHFTGRRGHLDMLDIVLAERPRQVSAVVVVTGTAGVGKTTLAVRWAHRVAGQFPDGQLHVNLRGFDPTASAMSPAEAVRGFLDALGVPAPRIPQSPDAQVGLYRSLLADRRVLVLLDNARDTDQVRPLLPAAPGCVAVVTSRNQLSGLVAAEGAHLLTLDVLSTSEARSLLAQRLGADTIVVQPEAVDEIVDRCARLPLALAIVCARAAACPDFTLSALAGELRQAQSIDVLDGGDPATDIRNVFSWSYHTLTPDTARLFRLLGLHPGPDITAPAAASLTALPLAQARRMLAGLARTNLLIEHHPGRYTLHDLLRAYATRLSHDIDPHHERHAATGRMLDHYLHTAYAAYRLLNPHREPITLSPPREGIVPEHLDDHGQAMAWFTAEHPVLVATVAHTVAAGWDSHAWQLALTLYDFLDRRGHWHDWTAVLTAALAAAGRCADAATRALIHRLLARAYIQVGSYDEARTHASTVLELYEQAGDEIGQAHAHHIIAHIWEGQGRPRDALHHSRQALTRYRATGQRRGQAIALNAVGWHLGLLGQHERALSHCQQALTLLQELGDRYPQAHTWDSLGYAHHHLGRHTRAITCYQHAIDIFRELGDRYTEAKTLSRLGDTQHTAGDADAARTAWQQALTILDDLDHPNADHVRAKLAVLRE
jgi:DNA-binding SARP family transcriptional activator/tetratricopeptide (TPR) repeat protein